MSIYWVDGRFSGLQAKKKRLHKEPLQSRCFSPPALYRLDQDMTIDAPRNRAFEKKQVAISIDPLYHQPFGSDSLVAHLARHFLALENVSWSQTGTDGTTVTEELVCTVSTNETSEVVLLHDAGKTTSL